MQLIGWNYGCSTLQKYYKVFFVAITAQRFDDTTLVEQTLPVLLEML
ncbi:protein of unknown function [Trichlorobacter ammonificans]|uniref:Uncharacterized protein n=1 Tax=Trichlorobacter ammonificans TaxID=2916410 RepID=A0ABN8HK86_9BACT|nr:protein of unknown function [Trichlorobacter ammonificans]